MMPKIRIDRTSSVVATGRRMKGSATFMAWSSATGRPPGDPTPLPDAPRSETLAPGVSRNWPSVTTTSPGARPSAITVSSPTCRSILIGRISTVRSALTTYTN